MSKRTDLAIEMQSFNSSDDKFSCNVRGKNFKITEINTENSEKYITLEGERLSHVCDNYKQMVFELTEEIKYFTNGKKHIMVVGLGNSDITPDSLGPHTASGIMATRHLKAIDGEDVFIKNLREVSVLLSGVLGTTGIESAEIVKSVAERINPDLIIAVDALACSDYKRLGKTIQMSNSGIAPGSGVENCRKELSYKTIGVPVLAIGVPTMIDVYTVAENITGKQANDYDIPNMMVTPKDIDVIVIQAAKMLATGINLALQPQLDFDEAVEMSAV